jgi:hypothetical protein
MANFSDDDEAGRNEVASSVELERKALTHDQVAETHEKSRRRSRRMCLAAQPNRDTYNERA